MPKDAAPEVMPDLSLDSLFSVKGKIGVVTGAGTGLGKSESSDAGTSRGRQTYRTRISPYIQSVVMAAAYAKNGAKKIYIASRKIDDLKIVAEQLNKLSPNKGEQRGIGAQSVEQASLTIPRHLVSNAIWSLSDDICVVALQADVATKFGCDALANQIKERETELDILVNNAGITWGAPLDNFPEEKGWDKTFHLNVKSQFYLTVA